jgi:hypothetical protein
MILQCFSFITQKWILEKYLLQNPKSRRMEDGQERERESEKSSSITIAPYMVRREREKRSIYTWTGKRTSIGLMPSVHHQAQGEIPRRGAHHLGFQAWI